MTLNFLGSNRGITLVEIMVVITAMVIISAASMPVFSNFYVSSQLDENSIQIVRTLRTARDRSVAGVNGSPHGIKLQSDRYILYQGPSFALRNIVYDRSVVLDSAMTLTWNLSGPDEINFSKGIGKPDNAGTITLAHSIKGNRTISINSYGLAEEQ